MIGYNHFDATITKLQFSMTKPCFGMGKISFSQDWHWFFQGLLNYCCLDLHSICKDPKLCFCERKFSFPDYIYRFNKAPEFSQVAITEHLFVHQCSNHFALIQHKKAWCLFYLKEMRPFLSCYSMSFKFALTINKQVIHSCLEQKNPDKK